jgi:hypothetical protein
MPYPTGFLSLFTTVALVIMSHLHTHTPHEKNAAQYKSSV